MKGALGETASLSPRHQTCQLWSLQQPECELQPGHLPPLCALEELQHGWPCEEAGGHVWIRNHRPELVPLLQ